jgi:hypothetical protein
MSSLSNQTTSRSRELERERIISLIEAAELTGLSQDSLRRHYSHLIRRLTPRRLGMKLGDVLAIGSTA